MSGTHGVFQHRTGYFYTILEEDFCEVYKKDGVNEVCRAYITSILEHLTNKQYDATGSDEDIWVFMSLPEMSRRMRHACSERTIHKELSGMIKDGYLFKRRAVGKATMEYKLNIKRIRKALEALPDVQPCNSATYHLANLQDQSGNSARSTLQNDKINLANLQPRITIDIPVEEPKNNESIGANANASRAALAADVEQIINETEENRTPSGKIIAIRKDVELDDPDKTQKRETTDPSQQTIPAVVVNAAQRTIASPQASNGSVGGTSIARTNGAVQASIPKRPGSRKVTQAKPTITLTAQQQAFWDLWCGVWFNAEIKPDLTETAYTHVVKLAPYITTSEQLNSLIDFTRKDLADSQNIKRKMVQLGNMVHSYPGWKQAQQPQSNNTPARDSNIGVSGLPRLPRREVKYG